MRPGLSTSAVNCYKTSLAALLVITLMSVYVLSPPWRRYLSKFRTAIVDEVRNRTRAILKEVFSSYNVSVCNISTVTGPGILFDDFPSGYNVPNGVSSSCDVSRNNTSTVTGPVTIFNDSVGSYNIFTVSGQAKIFNDSHASSYNISRGNISGTVPDPLAAAPEDRTANRTGRYVSLSSRNFDNRRLGNQLFNLAAMLHVARLTGRRVAMVRRHPHGWLDRWFQVRYLLTYDVTQT